MKPITIVTKELKPEYKFMDRMWNILFKRIFNMYARGWKHAPLVHYPLTIDIELGAMKYYFFDHGLRGIISRIDTYNLVLLDRVQGREQDLDPSKYYVTTTFTDDDSINIQLEDEIEDIESYY